MMPVKYQEGPRDQTGEQREIKYDCFTRLTGFAHFMNKGICGPCSEPAVQTDKCRYDRKPRRGLYYKERTNECHDNAGPVGL